MQSLKIGGAPLAVSRVNVLFNTRADKLVAFALPQVGVWGEEQIVFYVEKSQDGMCWGFSMNHTNAKLSNVALLHLFQSWCRGFFQCCIWKKNGPKIVWNIDVFGTTPLTGTKKQIKQLSRLASKTNWSLIKQGSQHNNRSSRGNILGLQNHILNLKSQVY